MTDTHLMIVHKQYVGPILSGHKRVEARLGVDRRAPFNRVNPGDTVYIKPSSQQVCARAIVHRVDQYEQLDHTDIARLRELYDDLVLGNDAFWDSKADAKYATFITLDKVQLIRDERFVPKELLEPSRNAWRTLSSRKQSARAA